MGWSRQPPLSSTPSYVTRAISYEIEPQSRIPFRSSHSDKASIRLSPISPLSPLFPLPESIVAAFSVLAYSPSNLPLPLGGISHDASDAGTHFVSFTGVVRAFVIEEAVFFQVMTPNRQGPRSGRFSEITFNGY